MRARRLGVFVERRFEALEDRRLLAAAPVGVNDKYTVQAGEMLVYEPGVLANDYDTDGDRLSVVLVGRPQHGAVALAPDGGFRYLPNPTFRGEDAFSYRAVSADGESAPTVVSLVVESSLRIAYWSAAEGGNGHAYALTSFESGTWSEAVDGAERLSLGGSFGHLTTITSQAEFDWTESHGGVRDFAYLGGYQDRDAPDYSEPAGGWRWITGEPWSFTAWSLGEPNNWGDGEHYLQDWYDGWNDIYGYGVNGAAVEFEGPVPLAFDSLVGTPADTALRVDFADLIEAGRLLDPGSTVEILTPPSHGALGATDAGGTTYVPNLGYSGRDQLVYRILTPRGPSEPARVWLKVDLDEFAPVTNGDVYWVDEDGFLDTAADGKASVLANDWDVDSKSLTVSLVVAPQHGTLALEPDGHFKYRPAADYYGADYFQYQVTDGFHTSPATVVGLAIDAKPDAPRAFDDFYELRGAGANVVDAAHGVLANDQDPDYPPRALLGAPPAHGAVSLASDGGFTYTPSSGFVGIDRFTYRANDYFFDSNLATVLLAVDVVFGDANGDGAVDLGDFGALKANFGQAGATLAQGDLDGDADVDLADFGLLKANFGRTAVTAGLTSPGALAIAPQATAAVDVRDLGWLRWAWDQRNSKPEGYGDR